MATLKILASGGSPPAQANARGKLFETLMADVLRHYGYRIDKIPNVNYAGMEIDIEGRLIISGVPLYAECKCYETEIGSPKFQAFFGKYMLFWLKDNRSQGLFIALPGLNPHAKGLYRENCEADNRFTLRLLEEDHVLEALYGTEMVARPEQVARSVNSREGEAGDATLLYTDKGCFWIQYVIPSGSGIPTSITVFDGKGSAISDRATIDYLVQLHPELADFDLITRGDTAETNTGGVAEDTEEIVEVRGSSACFEYQFPASPEYFVGRDAALHDLDSFVSAILDKSTSSRGILFEANSGWGKSSFVLAAVDRLVNAGHFSVAIDSRSASSSRFILRAVEYTLRKMQTGAGPLFENAKLNPISGFEGAVSAILSLKDVLERERRVLVMFFDQFENIFFQPDVLKRIRDLFLRVRDAQTNLVLGFSWKTDLIGLTTEFPYQLRDTLSGSSKRIPLDTFSDVETSTLLDRLAEELRSKLRKDLRFLLSEFSQGYPWLLKKLCAHVKSQREAGVPQSEIANSLLNVEELFQEDLQGLSTEEEDVLRRVAKAAPISIQELGEEFRPDVVQSLVNARLLVRIGNKYDVYWDIFRDYLNSGRLPMQENYILRMQIGGLMRAMKLLTDANGVLDAVSFQQTAGLSDGSFWNVTKDMRLLGLAKIVNGNVTLTIATTGDTSTFEKVLRDHLKERLPRNRLVSRLIDTLEGRNLLSVSEMASLLAEWCPYISGKKETWKTYARIFADWMDVADLAIFDGKNGVLSRYKPGTEIRERILLPTKRRGGLVYPRIQYNPIERAAIRIGEALKKENRLVDWQDFKKTTRQKTLAALEDLGFIIRKPKSIQVQPTGMQFISESDKRPELFAESALRMPSFKSFIALLNDYKDTRPSYDELGVKLREKLGTDWTHGTAKVNAKIMLDWARCSKLAPGVFARDWRRVND